MWKELLSRLELAGIEYQIENRRQTGKSIDVSFTGESENPAVIPKFGPEIKNHCSSNSVLQAEPFFFVATKIRIGRGA